MFIEKSLINAHGSVLKNLARDLGQEREISWSLWAILKGREVSVGRGCRTGQPLCTCPINGRNLERALVWLPQGYCWVPGLDLIHELCTSSSLPPIGGVDMKAFQNIFCLFAIHFEYGHIKFIFRSSQTIRKLSIWPTILLLHYEVILQ